MYSLLLKIDLLQSASTEKKFYCPIVRVPQEALLLQSKLPTIAYSLVVHHRADLLKNWFELAYDPENFYMIHVDAKSPREFYEEVNKSAYLHLFL